MFAYLSFLMLALVLGFKHSYDADHIIAVSNLLRRAHSMKFAIKMSASWAVGHMLTATAITVVLYIFRESLLSSVLQHFEKIVGIMLIVLGIISFRDVFKFDHHAHRHGSSVHAHPHLHGRQQEDRHAHKHMLGIGIIHGLASNDELLVLFTASLGVATLGEILIGVGVFSIGVVLGMVVFASFFSYPLVKLHSDKIYRVISAITGVVGIVYGLLMLFAAV